MDLDHPEPFYGIVDLPLGRRVVCASHVVREVCDDGQDWVDFCLPLGALGRADQRVGAYPFGGEMSSRAWRDPIDDWFIRVAEALVGQHRFELALIGYEVSGMDWQCDGGPAGGESFTYLTPSSSGIEIFPPRPRLDASKAALNAMTTEPEGLGLDE